MKHRLLILGTLGEFVQLVQKSREKGYYTIVCDGYPDGPARKFADEAYQIPVTDTERIAELCREKEIDGIITANPGISKDPYSGAGRSGQKIQA